MCFKRLDYTPPIHKIRWRGTVLFLCVLLIKCKSLLGSIRGKDDFTLNGKTTLNPSLTTLFEFVAELAAHKISELAQRIPGLLPRSNGKFRFTVKKHYLLHSTDTLLAVQQPPRAFGTCLPNFGYSSELIINYVLGSHPLQGKSVTSRNRRKSGGPNKSRE